MLIERTKNPFIYLFFFVGKKMGCFLFKVCDRKTKSYDSIPRSDEYENLRLKSTVTLSVRKKHNFPVSDLKFDGWNSAQAWPRDTKKK